MDTSETYIVPKQGDYFDIKGVNVKGAKIKSVWLVINTIKGDRIKLKWAIKRPLVFASLDGIANLYIEVTYKEKI